MAGITQEHLSHRVRRNFIPAGQETPAELADRARRQQRGLRQGIIPNFIPDPAGHKSVFLGPEVEAAKSQESAERRSQNAKVIRWDEAQKVVTRMTPAGAIEFIGGLPKASQELFLLVEEATQNRSAVLDRFGKVSDKARAIWSRGDTVPEVPVEVVSEAATPDTDEARARDLPVAEVTPTPEESPRPRKTRGAQANAQSIFSESEIADEFTKVSGIDVTAEDEDEDPVAAAFAAAEAARTVEE